MSKRVKELSLKWDLPIQEVLRRLFGSRSSSESWTAAPGPDSEVVVLRVVKEVQVEPHGVDPHVLARTMNQVLEEACSMKFCQEVLDGTPAVPCGRGPRDGHSVQIYEPQCIDCVGYPPRDPGNDDYIVCERGLVYDGEKRRVKPDTMAWVGQCFDRRKPHGGEA